MGVSTSSSASFGTMASNIKNIKGSISINATGCEVHTRDGFVTSGIVNKYSVQGTYSRINMYGVDLSNTGEGVYDIDILTYYDGYIWSNASSNATIIDISNYTVHSDSFITDSDNSTFRYHKVILKAVKNGSRYNVYSLKNNSLLYTDSHIALSGMNKKGGTGYFSVFMTKF